MIVKHIIIWIMKPIIHYILYNIGTNTNYIQIKYEYFKYDINTLHFHNV